MKRTFSILLLTVLVSVLTACGVRGNTAEEVPVKIGVTMYDEYDPFTASIAENITQRLKDLASEDGRDIEVSVVSSSKNQLLQNEQVEEFIDSGCNVICVNLVDRTDATVIIDKAKKADIPIIFFNRELVQDDLNRFDKLYYVGANPEVSGEIQGQIVIDALSNRERFNQIDANHDGAIQYVILEGEAGHQDAIVRSRVSVETIKAAGINTDRLGDEIANWDRKQAETKTKALLARHPWIELILANDDNMALGALDALKNQTDTMPLIVGVNGQAECLEAIEAGLIEGTAYNNAIAKGQIIANMSYSLATEGHLPYDLVLTKGKYIYVPYEKITRDNVEEYKK